MRSASIISNSVEAPQSFKLFGFFCVAYLANLKGAEDEGFIYPIAQFLQENGYIKIVHEDLYMKKDPPACPKHGGRVFLNILACHSYPCIVLF